MLTSGAGGWPRSGRGLEAPATVGRHRDAEAQRERGECERARLGDLVQGVEPVVAGADAPDVERGAAVVAVAGLFDVHRVPVVGTVVAVGDDREAGELVVVAAFAVTGLTLGVGEKSLTALHVAFRQVLVVRVDGEGRGVHRVADAQADERNERNADKSDGTKVRGHRASFLYPSDVPGISNTVAHIVLFDNIYGKLHWCASILERYGE